MKPELQRVAIPRGWRKLRVGEIIARGDRWVDHSQPRIWYETVMNGKRVHKTWVKTTYIRKRTARPRKGKARKVGGS